MTSLLFPLWQIDRQEYDATCAYLGLTPKARTYDCLTEYLAKATFRFPRLGEFSRYLAKPRLTRWRIARLDLATKLFIPDHPIRYILNCVIALHECDAEGYRELAASPHGWKAMTSMFGWVLGFGANLTISLPWFGWQLLGHVSRAPFGKQQDLAGRRILISGVNRGLGRDLMLHCLERGAEVIGTVRSDESSDRVKAELPANAPLMLLVADLSTPGALVEALRKAQIPVDCVSMAILCAATKHDGQSVLSLANLRDTFQVNFFSAVELADWLCRSGSQDDSTSHPRTEKAGEPSSKTALVLVSSMGRWHGMHFSCGYNASKAALSIWGESLDMELRQLGNRRFTVTVVEPGMFASGMTSQTTLTRLLFASRRNVASRIVSGALAGRRVIRPPYWFALVTWGVCLLGRNFRYRLFASAKPRADRQ